LTAIKELENRQIKILTHLGLTPFHGVRNMSMKMRYPVNKLESMLSVDGLLIQAATGGDSGTGILSLNRFGYFSNALASASDLCW
jgi:hypothetical protein